MTEYYPFSDDETKAAWDKSAERRRMGKALEKMRRKAELSRSEVARRMGKDPAFVSRMETGVGSMPKAENISAFALACDKQTAYVFFGEDASGHAVISDYQPIEPAGEHEPAMWARGALGQLKKIFKRSDDDGKIIVACGHD